MSRRYWFSCASMLAVVAAGPSLAQDAAPPPHDGRKVEEIVVTAQRTSQKLQDVPIAVSAVSSKKLAQTGVKDVTDLRAAIPSLQVVSATGYTFIQLRGVGGTANGPGVENAVATYVDGIYYGSQLASLLGLANVERVEVDKGPQGTLFGRNATGGVIQIITKDPSQQRSGNLDVSYANYNTVRTEGYLNGGLTNNLAANLAFQYTHQGDGWGRNIATGEPTYAIDYDWNVRGKLLFTPTESTRIVIAGDYSSTRNSMDTASLYPGTRGSTAPFGTPQDGAPPFLTPPPYPVASRLGSVYDSNADTNSVLKGTQAGGSIRWDQDFDIFKLATISAYRSSSFRRIFDFDVSPIRYTYLDIIQNDHQLSQEVQLLSPASSKKLTWVLGTYYYNAIGAYGPDTTFLPGPNPFFHGEGLEIPVNSKVSTDSIAGYAQSTWEILPATRLTGGIRYTHETKTLTGNQTGFLIPGNIPFPPAGLSTHQPEVAADKITFRASVDHRFSPDVLAYASFNRGFKSGGFNAGSITAPGYRPETLDSYEIGLKSTFFDHRLRLNVAGFYSNYKDIQIQVVQGTTTGIINGPSAEIYGVDGDFEARLTNNLSINGGFQILSDQFGTFTDAPFGTALGGVPLTSGNATGHQLPYVSHVTLGIGPVYDWQLADGSSVTLAGSYYFNSGFYPIADNIIHQRGFSLINLSAKWTSANGHWDFTAWGKNLADEKTVSIVVDLPFGQHFTTWSAPLTFGGTIGYRF